MKNLKMQGKLTMRQTLLNFRVASFMLAVLFLSSQYCLFAEGTSGKYEISPDIVEKVLSSGTISLNRIAQDAEKNIQKVNKSLQDIKNKETVTQLITEGQELYAAGHFDEAKNKWAQAEKISTDSIVRDHLKQIERIEKEKAIEIKRKQQENSKDNSPEM